MAPKITIVSPFRDSSADVPPYIRRVEALDYPADRLRIIVIEGDSTDDTLAQLLAWQDRDERLTVCKCDVHRPKFGSIVNPERFKILAQVFNTGMDEAASQNWADYVLFIPSDVLYERDLINRLLGHQKDMIAPMFWTSDNHPNGGRFYDIWGFRRGGQHFPPYGWAWFKANLPREPVEMETIGGVILMRIEVLEAGCRYTPDHVDHGLCKAAQAAGFTVWCDPTTHVLHR